MHITKKNIGGKLLRKLARDMWKENSPQTRKILTNFKERLNTPEGKRRAANLGLSEEDVSKLKKLKLKHTTKKPTSYNRKENKVLLQPTIDFSMLGPLTRHEIEHAVQKKLPKKKAFNLIDKDLKQLKLQEKKYEPEDFDWGNLDYDNPFGDFAIQTPKAKLYTTDEVKSILSDNDKGKSYFIKGSAASEKAPMLAELQQWAVQNKIIDNPYQEVSPSDIKSIYNTYEKLPKEDQTLRIFNIIEPTESNFNLLSNNFNKLLTLTGLGVTGAAIAQQKKGGLVLKRLQTGGTQIRSGRKSLENQSTPLDTAGDFISGLFDSIGVYGEEGTETEVQKKRRENERVKNLSKKKVVNSQVEIQKQSKKIKSLKDQDKQEKIEKLQELKSLDTSSFNFIQLQLHNDLISKLEKQINSFKRGGKAVKKNMKCGEVKKSTRKNKKIMKLYNNY